MSVKVTKTKPITIEIHKLKDRDMELHKIIEVHGDSGEFLFRKMRVESGFIYIFSDSKENKYKKQSVFVPDPIENEDQKNYLTEVS